MVQNELTKADQAQEEPLCPLMNVPDVAQILRIVPKTVNKLVREGKLGCVQISSRDRRFTKEQVQAYIDSNEVDVLIDRTKPDRVGSSKPKEGDKQNHDGEKAKDSWASLRKEMSRWT